MKSFVAGLRAGQRKRLSLPAEYIYRSLAEIDDLAEMKLTLFCLLALGQKEGQYRYLRHAELMADDNLMRGIALIDQSRPAVDLLQEAIARAIARGTLLESKIELAGQTRRMLMLNDEDGRTVHRQIEIGEWLPAEGDEIEILPVRPTLYGLYEANIGALTPMIAESIKEAEATYPYEWIEDAMQYAVERNARNWRYIRKVLETWQREGRRGEESGRDLERQRRYTAGEWEDHFQR